MRTAGDRRAEGLREIAYEIARLEERRRPREFREGLAPGMSVEEGIRGRAEAAFRELAVGDADMVVGRLLEVSEGCDACMRRAERIAKRIRSLRRGGSESAIEGFRVAATRSPGRDGASCGGIRETG